MFAMFIDFPMIYFFVSLALLIAITGSGQYANRVEVQWPVSSMRIDLNFFFDILMWTNY